MKELFVKVVWIVILCFESLLPLTKAYGDCQINGVVAPRFIQGDYTQQDYDHIGPIKISRRGCALCCVAMVMNYVAGSTITDPIQLNEWLKNNQGYTKGDINWWAIDKYPGLGLKYDRRSPRSGRNDAALCDAFSRNLPVILKVGTGHYIVATGFTTVGGQQTIAIRDPRSNTDYQTLLDFPAYNNTYSGYRVYYKTPATPQRKSLSVWQRLGSFLKFYITDASGRRVGENPGNTIYEEIPGSRYLSDFIDTHNPDDASITEVFDSVHIDSPADGNYSLTVVGTVSENFAVRALYTDLNGQETSQDFSGSIASGQTQSFNFSLPIFGPIAGGGGGGGDIGGGCVKHGSLIATPQGLRPIESFRPGDQVLGWTGTATAPTIVQHVWVHEGTWTLYEVGGLWLTAEHQVLVNGDWRSASALSSTPPQVWTGRVYDLTTGLGNFGGERGMIVHNFNLLFLQKRMTHGLKVPSEVFQLGQAFSFPNPAKGVNPTLHFEVGQADEVSATLYNQAGQEVWHTTIPGHQVLIVDGTYAYETSVDVSNLASGIYIAKLTAKKAGQRDLTATVKVAVVK